MIIASEPIGLHELLGKGGQLRRRDLIRAVQDHDVLVGEYLDEELMLCGNDPNAEPDRHWMPYLSRQDAHDRQVAVETTARHLESLGSLELGKSEGDYELAPPHSLIAHALAEAGAAVTWRMMVRGEDDGGRASGALLLPDGVVLHDDIDDGGGQHVLVFRSAEREARHVAVWMDARSACRETEQPIVASRVADLRPSPDELAARARSSTVVARVARTPQGGIAQAVTAYGTDEGLWLLQGHDGPEPIVSLQLVSDADLLALTRRLTLL